METIVLIFILLISITVIKELSKKKKPLKRYKNNNKNWKYKNKKTLMNVTDIAVFFNIKSVDLNKIFLELQWIERKEKWIMITELGLENGANQEYSTNNKQKYVKWDPNILENKKLINIIQNNKPKESKDTKIKKINNKINNKQKGDEYEAYVCKVYESDGYTVIATGKIKGVEDGGIDIIAKKGRNILFIQCKNWKSNQIRDKHIKITRQDVSDYLKKYPIYKSLDYEIKIIYAISEDKIHGSAYHYLKKYNDEIELKIIPM